MRTPAPKIIRAFLLLAALATLTACASHHREDTKTGALTPTEQWNDRINVTAYPDEVLLAVHADGLSAAQADALDGFLARWAQAEGGVITLRSPRRPDRPGEADAIARAARDFLVAEGAPAWRIEMDAYDATGAAQAPLVVSFDRHQVETPICGANIENLTRTTMNKPSENFGCAVTSNLAAQVANPADLLGPRDMDPADAQRRSTVLGKYRAGQLTASPREEQASGTVSKAVN
jgi:pilus assembly protein CpaD